MNYNNLRFPGFLDKALTLSYDDGVVFDKKLIEIMKKYGLKGTFNINSGYFGADRRLTKEEALELYSQEGIEVAVHGAKHLNLIKEDKDTCFDEISSDRIALEEMFGKIVNGMAYSYGTFNNEVVEILKECGIKYSRTVMSSWNFDIPKDWLRLEATCHHNQRTLMELAKSFIEDPLRNNAPKLFYLWGHSYEFNDNDNWYIIEDFAEYMGNRENVWYATNMEIFDYVKAYDSLEFSFNKNIVFNPTLTDVYLNINGKDILVKSGETKSI